MKENMRCARSGTHTVVVHTPPRVLATHHSTPVLFSFAIVQDDEHPELSAAIKLNVSDLLSAGDKASRAQSMRDVERSALQVSFRKRLTSSPDLLGE